MKILIACALPDFALEQLRTLGSEVCYEPELRTEQLRDRIADVGILVVDTRRISPEVVARGDALQMIVHAGPGPGDIAMETASAQGVFVMNCPDQHTTAVAELAFGLILALDRRIVDNTIAVRERRWIRGELERAQGLFGRTLGILCYGPVGRLVAQRAHAFGMNVLAWCPVALGECASGTEVTFVDGPRELARASDVITVHAGERCGDPRVLVDAEFLGNMRPGAALVHVGHPAVIDETALAQAVRQRGLRVALDVFGSQTTSDAGRFRSKLCELPGVIGTQRIGALTEQAFHATAAEVVHIIESFLVSGELINCLNLAVRSPATWQLVLRVRDAVGVMAAILEAIRADGINAEEITSRVFTGARAAWCTIALDERPSTEALEAIRALDEVLYSELRAVV